MTTEGFLFIILTILIVALVFVASSLIMPHSLVGFITTSKVAPSPEKKKKSKKQKDPARSK